MNEGGETSTVRNGQEWIARPVDDLLSDLSASASGLTSAEAAARLRRDGPNALSGADAARIAPLLGRQFGSPIVLILIAAAFLSFALRDPTDGAIILVIVLVSALLGFWQEFRAATAVATLRKRVSVQAEALRDGTPVSIPVAEVVVGDIVLLSAGAGIPADCRLLESRDLMVNEAALTGETFPVEKTPGNLAADTPLAKRRNALFQGTYVVSGVGRALVLRTGRATEFGAIAESLRARPSETGFEQGVRRFGMLLIRLTLVLVFLIFAFNVFLHRPVLDSFLFALALAVGLTPELLPAIISVNLASGARRMAGRKVIVKRLTSIENFGSMDVLCSDKTGTLTEGRIALESALDAAGRPDAEVLRLARLNAGLQSGFHNPIDAALLAESSGTGRRKEGQAPDNPTRLDEIPYDFTRKRLSILTRLSSGAGSETLITKGALAEVLECCSHVRLEDGSLAPLKERRESLETIFRDASARGLRTLGLATKGLPGKARLTREDEADMTFAGFLLFTDPPKAGIAETIRELRELGVRLKIITGDNAWVAGAIAAQIGLREAVVMTGKQLREIGDEALPHQAGRTDVFAEVEPNQKERIIRALRKAGHIVGYMGDGINDAPALHAADVGLSVQGAADVAKDAADIVLLEPDLAVLADGVREGRATFINTQKYVFMATSANFGNMFSMAGASLLLPFLPLLPKQILLTNLVTDFPEMTIATDRVDAERLRHPQKWDMKLIRRFMFRFGLLSSVFDFLTFAVLYFGLKASPALFRSGWFVESVASAALVVLVLRTRGPFWRSRPSRVLVLTTLTAAGAAVALPFSPLGPVFGFVPLPLSFLGLMAGIVVAYIGAAELMKKSFYRHAR